MKKNYNNDDNQAKTLKQRSKRKQTKVSQGIVIAMSNSGVSYKEAPTKLKENIYLEKVGVSVTGIEKPKVWSKFGL